MSALGSAMFDTAIGVCGIVWGERGVAGVYLPERSERETRARLGRRFPTAVETAPPPVIVAAIEAIASLLAGHRTDLDHVGLDLGGVPAFDAHVYAAARAIRPGTTLTYGAVAERIGAPGAAREVGEALGRNPFPLVVPCHRVVASGGKLGGFSAHGGVVTKRRLLEIERARSTTGPDLFDLPAGPS